MKFLGNSGSKLQEAIYRQFRRTNHRLYRSDVKYSEDDHRAEFMRRAFHALGFNGISGDYAEFGSHGGTTFALAHSEIVRWRQKRMLWAFDSFQGLPDQRQAEDYHPGWKKGKMATSKDRFVELCQQRGIPEDAYRIIEGYYENSLGGKSADDPDLPSDIALAYIDCDLYSSTRTVLEFLKPRLKNGMIIAFDDYYCFSDRTISGERRAMLEVFTEEFQYQLEPYVQYGWHGMSFVVENKRYLTK